MRRTGPGYALAERTATTGDMLLQLHDTEEDRLLAEQQLGLIDRIGLHSQSQAS